MYSDNPDTQTIRSGYVHSSSVDTLVDAAAAHCRRYGCTPFFVITHPVAFDSAPVLDALSLRLYNRGLISNRNIHNFSLLVLLSTVPSQKERLLQLYQAARQNDGLLFLSDAYRFDYDREQALALLKLLAQMYQRPSVQCPVVLKLPDSYDQNLFQRLPELHNNCFHLTKSPVSTEPPVDDCVSSPPREGFWYQTDNALYEQEYLGLKRYLEERRLAHTIEPTLFTDGRLSIQVQLRIQELGLCKILVVYGGNFHRQNREPVRTAIACGDHPQLLTRLHQVSRVYDTVVGGHLFDPPRSPGITARNGAGAAALDALIRAMI